MKKSILGIVMVIALVLSLAMCTNPATGNVENPSNTQPESITVLEEDVWPVNQYTDGLPVPAGAVGWVTLDAEHDTCSISMTDINERECEEYLELLKQEGFSLVAETSETVQGQDYVSIGTILSDGEKGLSISYIPGNLTLYISFE